VHFVFENQHDIWAEWDATNIAVILSVSNICKGMRQWARLYPAGGPPVERRPVIVDQDGGPDLEAVTCEGLDHVGPVNIRVIRRTILRVLTAHRVRPDGEAAAVSSNHYNHGLEGQAGHNVSVILTVSDV
jgi:hypothetical protein